MLIPTLRATLTAMSVAVSLAALSGAGRAEVGGSSWAPQLSEPSARAATPSKRAQANHHYVILFRERSFTLDRFRKAVRSEASHAVIQRIVRDFEAAVQRDQARFVERLAALGGRVTRQWWLVNGCAAEFPPRALAAVRALPNVWRVDVDRERRPHLSEATNSAHHNSDAVNLTRDKQGNLIRGTGVSVAVLDTGADASSGATGRPHLSYYPQGNLANNQNGGVGGSLLKEATHVIQVPSGEDSTGHGSAVAGCVGANTWNTLPGVDDGIAPGAGIVSVNIANSAGISLDSWIVSGWQLATSLRAQHNIAVGNNSFTGSPSLSNIVQVALDEAAYHADILICVSAGNDVHNTTESQHSYNGLAVGSADKGTLQRSSFSAIGPLHNTQRTYPDILAIGDKVATVLHDDEANKFTATGTSYAAPLVAGTAALIRQTNPGLTAVEVKAALLNTTLLQNSNRNECGLGFLKADAAVAAARGNEVVSGTVSDNRRIANFAFKSTVNRSRVVTVVWMRRSMFVTPPNLNLRIFDDNNQLVVEDGNAENSYEQVRLQMAAGIVYRAEVEWMNPSTSLEPVEFAIAGVTDHSTPVLTHSNPAAVHSYDPGIVEIIGDALATVTDVTLGSQSVEFTVMDDTTIRFAPQNLLPIGPMQIRVTNPSGTSNAITLQITGRKKPLFVGQTLVTRGPALYRYSLYSDQNWRSLLTVSLSDRPSTLPGFYDLGIGNNFTELILLVYLNQDARGASSVNLNFPASVPSSTKVYFQALSTDPTAPTYPFPVSNVLPVQIF